MSNNGLNFGVNEVVLAGTMLLGFVIVCRLSVSLLVRWDAETRVARQSRLAMELAVLVKDAMALNEEAGNEDEPLSVRELAREAAVVDVLVRGGSDLVDLARLAFRWDETGLRRHVETLVDGEILGRLVGAAVRSLGDDEVRLPPFTMRPLAG